MNVIKITRSIGLFALILQFLCIPFQLLYPDATAVVNKFFLACLAFMVIVLISNIIGLAYNNGRILDGWRRSIEANQASIIEINKLNRELNEIKNSKKIRSKK